MKKREYQIFHLTKRHILTDIETPIAVFTDQDLMNDYVKKLREQDKEAIFSYIPVAYFTELKPVASNFNVPLNPAKFVPIMRAGNKSDVAIVEKPKNKVLDNPVDPKPVGKDEPVSALLGITIGRKGGAGNNK